MYLFIHLLMDIWVISTFWLLDCFDSFSISPSNEYLALISFRIDWFDLLAVQGTLKSLLQHHSSEASILQCSAFFMVQLSYLYLTTGKTIALTIHLVPWIKHVPGLLEWVIFSQA